MVCSSSSMSISSFHFDLPGTSGAVTTPANFVERKVVTLLQEMMDKSKDDGKADRTVSVISSLPVRRFFKILVSVGYL